MLFISVNVIWGKKLTFFAVLSIELAKKQIYVKSMFELPGCCQYKLVRVFLCLLLNGI